MKAKTKNIILTIGVVLILSLGYIVVMTINNAPSSPIIVSQASFIEAWRDPSDVISPIRHNKRYFSFKLDSGETIDLRKDLGDKPQWPEMNPGLRVNIYYQKGVIFRNILVHYWQPLNMNQKYRETIPVFND